MVKHMPFKLMVKTYLFLGESLHGVIERLNKFGFSAKEEDISIVFEEMKSIVSPSICGKLNDKISIDPYVNEEEKAWLEHDGLFEFFDFVKRRKQNLEAVPQYFKWFNDCLWILSDVEVTTIVNILLFNGDKHETISDLISCKYKKKIGMEALSRYVSIFWNCELSNSKDVLYFYPSFKENALIFKSSEVKKFDSSNDGIDEEVVFNDSNYIKWKIGYKKIEPPSADDFLEQIKMDSMFKYYEAMHMTKSVEEETEMGSNDKVGAFDSVKTKRRNVEENRIKLAKEWVALYLRAHKAKSPVGITADEDIFKKMEALEIKFDDEKLALITDNPQLMEDIKNDM